MTEKNGNFILDADVRSFFDEVSQSWLIRFVEYRVGDPRIIRLIQKWWKAGVLEDGVVTVSEKGRGQGPGSSRLRANAEGGEGVGAWAGPGRGQPPRGGGG